jgi:hypothetical protein
MLPLSVALALLTLASGSDRRRERMGQIRGGSAKTQRARTARGGRTRGGSQASPKIHQRRKGQGSGPKDGEDARPRMGCGKGARRQFIAGHATSWWQVESDWDNGKGGPPRTSTSSGWDDSQARSPRPPRSENNTRGRGARGRGGSHSNASPRTPTKKALDLADKTDFPALASTAPQVQAS